MYTALSPGAIGVRPQGLEEALAAARTGGFEGLEIDVRLVAALVEERGAERARGVFADAGVRPAGWSLPVDWRGGEETWRAGLEELPRLAEAAAAVGGTRTSTYVLPGSDERTYDEHRRFCIERFTPIARVLAQYSCSLGLEFIGPKTLRDSFAHPFIYRMEDMLELGAEIGPNVGLLLDCWHWYTSGGTLDDLGRLEAERVVYVHVNDAPAGVPIDEQVDDVRALPGETGVIPIVDFLSILHQIGYDGPVVPEPFKRELNDLPSDEARLKAVGASMENIFRLANLR